MALGTLSMQSIKLVHQIKPKGCFWGKDSTAGIGSISAHRNKFTKSKVTAEIFFLPLHWQAPSQADPVVLLMLLCFKQPSLADFRLSPLILIYVFSHLQNFQSTQHVVHIHNKFKTCSRLRSGNIQGLSPTAFGLRWAPDNAVELCMVFCQLWKPSPEPALLCYGWERGLMFLRLQSAAGSFFEKLLQLFALVLFFPSFLLSKSLMRIWVI